MRNEAVKQLTAKQIKQLALAPDMAMAAEAIQRRFTAGLKRNLKPLAQMHWGGGLQRRPVPPQHTIYDRSAVRRFAHHYSTFFLE